MQEHSLNPSFTDSSANRILARAAELDALNGTTLRLPELRAIAVEVGISAEAFDQAVAEARRVPVPRDTIRSRPRSLLGTVTMIAVGVALATLSVAADNMSLGSASAFAVFGPSAAFIVYRALVHRRKGSLYGFLNEAAVLFGSFTAAALAMNGTQALAPCAAWALACAVAGSGVVTYERDITSEPDPEPAR